LGVIEGYYEQFSCKKTIQSAISFEGIFVFVEVVCLSQKNIEIEGINILFKKNIKSKKLRIRITPKGGAVVTMPWFFPYCKAKAFAQEHLGWIRANLEKVEKFKKHTLVFDENTDFTTKNHRLVILKKDIKKSFASIKDSKICVNFSLADDILAEENQLKIRSAIIEAFRLEAKEYLPSRVELLANKFGLKYRDLTIKNLSSRWGSCSGRDNINLNLHLIRLPYELIDYVILHELAHTREKNHSAKFWQFLSKLMPEAIELNKKLKFYKMEIF